MKQPWIIITFSAVFAVFQAYVFRCFIDPGLIYDFILFFIISVVIKIVLAIKIAKNLIKIDGENAYGLNSGNYELAINRLKKAKFISIANMIVFIVTFFVSYFIITN